MKATQMLSLLNRTPFQPIEIHLSDGMVIHVESPFEIRALPNSATCIVFDDEGIARFVSYRNMTQVVTADVDVNGSE